MNHKIDYLNERRFSKVYHYGKGHGHFDHVFFNFPLLRHTVLGYIGVKRRE